MDSIGLPAANDRITGKQNKLNSADKFNQQRWKHTRREHSSSAGDQNYMIWYDEWFAREKWQASCQFNPARKPKKLKLLNGTENVDKYKVQVTSWWWRHCYETHSWYSV